MNRISTIAQKKEPEVNHNFFPGKKNNNLFFQPKLTIGPVDDPYEREADTVANKVMQMDNGQSVQTKISSTGVQRKCAHCEEEENIQRKEIGVNSQLIEAPAIVDQAIHSGGTSLDGNTRSFMENRFGYDFGSVKIHTDSIAAKSAQSINALAYTSGNSIVFNNNQYSPGTESGKKLLAHELTHVVQQKGANTVIQRACDPATQVEYDTLANEIRQLPLFRNVPRHSDALHTPAQTRSIAEQIITQARSRDECLYYVQHLRTLFSTPEAPASAVRQRWGPILAQAAQDEQQRLQDPQSQQDAQFEEALSADPARTWTQMRGQDRKIYYVDATDPANVVVKIKVKLTGRRQFVDQAKQLEDGIEKASSILGYTVDLQFVNRSGSDVFEAGVNPNLWPTSGNWSGNVSVMAHELHHLLNLPDRYNYIESHSGNAQMYVANRIHWFREEFNRPPDPNISVSFMGRGNLVTDEDVCAAIQATDVSGCVSQRQSLRTGTMGMKFSAGMKTQRISEVLNGIIPTSLLDPRADETTLPLAQDRVRRTAENVFGRPLTDEVIQSGLSRIRNNLLSARIQMENTTAPRCRGEHIYFSQNPLAIVICPSFTALGTNEQQRLLLRTAYRIYQEVSVDGRFEAMMGRPMDPLDADLWARFVLRAYSRI